MFRVLFSVAVGDCYLNGPCVREEEKYLAVFLSILALMANIQWAFLLAELAWFVVFARTGFASAQKQPEQTAEKSEDVTPKVAENAIPAQLKEFVDKAIAQFEQHRVGDMTCDGLKWEITSNANGDVISKAAFPGQNFLRWRIESTLYGKYDDVIAEMFDYNKRAGPNGWDPKLAKGLVHREYDDGYRITVFSTNPMAGGVVSGREFIEVRQFKRDEDKLTFQNAGLGLDEKEWKQKLGAAFPPTDKSLTKAMSYSGGGFYMSPAQPGLGRDVPQTWNYQLINCTAIGGWIPASTINSATGSTLVEVTSDTKKHFLNKFKQQ